MENEVGKSQNDGLVRLPGVYVDLELPCLNGELHPKLAIAPCAINCTNPNPC